MSTETNQESPNQPGQHAVEHERPRGVIRLNRFEIGLNVVIQILLAAFVVGLVNYLGYRHYTRIDLSRDQRFTLSSQTLQVLQNLDEPVEVIVYFSPESLLYRDVDALLREYRHAGRDNLIVERVDPFRNLARARELVTEFRLGPDEDVLVVIKGDRHQFVSATDMAIIDSSGMMFGEQPRVESFIGEQALSSAIIELSEDRPRVLRYLTGHGELNPMTSERMQLWLQYVSRENVDLEPLNLMEVDAVPDETDLLLIAGPQYDLSEREIELLREYWQRRGPLYILTNPTASTPRLDAFVQEIGVTVREDRIIRTMPIGGGLIGVLQDVTTRFLPDSPVSRTLQGVNGLLAGGAQSLVPNEELAQDRNLRVTPLMEAGEGYWGETDYARAEETGYRFDPATDHAAPLYVAYSVEKGALDDDRVQMETARSIVVGGFMWLTDEGMQGASLDFFLGGMNWLMQRDHLIGIAPKDMTLFTLNLSAEQITKLNLLTLVAMPAFFAAMGLAVWWQRRR